LIGVIYSLAKNPEKQEKLRAEIRQVLPEKNSPLTADNMRNMPYLRAVIKEALRMLPPASGTIRAAGQELVIQGYQIPQGTNLLVSNALLSMEEQHFPRSQEFLPERWIRENADSGCPNARNANPFVYLPFGFGARMCVGRRMAEMEIEVLVARMVREFQIEWHHAPLKYKSTLLNVPDGDIRFRLKEVE
jgi:cytochrome P450 family 12